MHINTYINGSISLNISFFLVFLSCFQNHHFFFIFSFPSRSSSCCSCSYSFGEMTTYLASDLIQDFCFLLSFFFSLPFSFFPSFFFSSIFLSLYLPIILSLYLSISLSLYLSISLSLYLSIYPMISHPACFKQESTRSV